METAQALGDEASAKGVEALAALPNTAAIDAKDIDDLKRMGKHHLADSLANVKRMLDSSDFTLNMMSGMASFANMGDWAEGNTDGTNVISNAIASKPNINNPTAYNTYQVNWSSVDVEILLLHGFLQSCYTDQLARGSEGNLLAR